jgi:CIC family chloride channel protein
MTREQRRLLFDTIALGVIGALGAQAFILLQRLAQAIFLGGLAGYQPPGIAAEGGILQTVIGAHGLWLIPVVTTLGGLISGILVYSLAPEAEGHGTDTAVKAYHQSEGLVRTRVPFLKMIASAITIGSGGSAGREGPTALISAGIGSIYATLSHQNHRERQLLVLIGMAAGLSAIFRSPIGSALFAVEVLYGGMDFEVGALLYTLLGSIVAYAVNGLFSGWQPLFIVPANLGTTSFFDYGWYVLLGIASGLVGTLLPEVFYRVRDLFRALPIPNHVKPALGGLGLGLVAMMLPQVLGGGYGWIQEAINGSMALQLMLILVLAKLLAFALTVSSGGSGGVFAPSLFVGAMLGGALAQVVHQPSAAFVIVGMAAVFGAAARVPLATLLMVTEMTGGYSLLVPAALAVVLSFLIEVTLSDHLKYQSLYEAQVPGRADSPAHQVDHVADALHLINTRSIVLPSTTGHIDIRRLLATGLPIDLPDGKRLVVGILKPKSPFVGQSIDIDFPANARDELDPVSVFRQGHTLLPRAGLRLHSGDRLLLIVTPEAWQKVAASFEPLTLKAVKRPSPVVQSEGVS